MAAKVEPEVIARLLDEVERLMEGGGGAFSSANSLTPSIDEIRHAMVGWSNLSAVKQVELWTKLTALHDRLKSGAVNPALPPWDESLTRHRQAYHAIFWLALFVFIVAGILLSLYP